MHTFILHILWEYNNAQKLSIFTAIFKDIYKPRSMKAIQTRVHGDEASTGPDQVNITPLKHEPGLTGRESQ